MTGGVDPQPRHTLQAFRLADDPGDIRPHSLGYRGVSCTTDFGPRAPCGRRPAPPIEVWGCADENHAVALRVHKPNDDGGKSRDAGYTTRNGTASASAPLHLQFTVDREGYHQFALRLADATHSPTRACVKVAYQALRTAGLL